MTSAGGGKQPGKDKPKNFNMLFNSGDYSSSSNKDMSKLFESNDSAAQLFQSADFLESLDAYKESMNASNGENQNADVSGFFKSADFLKSLEALPKQNKEGIYRSIEMLKSLDFSSKDNTMKQIKNVFNSREWSSDYKPDDNMTINKSFFQSQESVKPKPVPVKTEPGGKKAGQDFFTSRDWMGRYEPGHVDVAYDNSLFKTEDSIKADKKMEPKESKTSKWMQLYEAADPPGLVVPQPAAQASMPLLTGSSVPPVAAAASQPVAASKAEPEPAKKPKKKRVYKSRKIVPEVKVFVEYTDDDVLLGRGGLSNKHPGNKRYRQEIENAKDVYRSASKDEKTEWASLLVEYVKKYGGRFLEKDKETGKWYLVDDRTARRKAGQALREDNTAESRKEKRDRYKRAHGKL